MDQGESFTEAVHALCGAKVLFLPYVASDVRHHHPRRIVCGGNHCGRQSMSGRQALAIQLETRIRARSTHRRQALTNDKPSGVGFNQPHVIVPATRQ